MTETNRRQHHITSGFIRVVTDTQTQFPAFWAHPVVGGPFPGLILLHDDWGLEAIARAIAYRLAEDGYYAIVPDLFEGRRAHSQFEADALETYFKPLAHPKVNAALQALSTHPKCNRKLAVVGWDLGAELAMQLAIERSDLVAAAAVSGDPSKFLGQFEDLKCPLLAVFGSEDPIAKQTESRLRQELAATDGKHEVVSYPGASHAFYSHLTSEYNHDAAEDNWTHILDFLENHQGKPPAAERTATGQFRPGRIY